MTATPFKLTEFEAQSALWQKVSAELQAMLDSRRLRNDCDLTEKETARLRGEIALLKQISSWAVKDPTL